MPKFLVVSVGEIQLLARVRSSDDDEHIMQIFFFVILCLLFLVKTEIVNC